MRLRKLLTLLLCASLCLTPAAATDENSDAAEPDGNPIDLQAATVPVEGLADDPPQLHALSAALLCAENGQLLLSKGATEKLAPASITKLMSALVVLESGIDLDQTVTVSYDAVHSIEPGSTHIALDTDEVVTLRDMMGAMLVESANDASNVLAETVGGSLEGFAALMNEKAAALGCKDTHFVNANGLDDDEHYTTAYDMALISQALTKYPEVFEYLGTSVYTMPATNKQEERQFWTKQNFCRPSSRWYDEKVLGAKNGWTTNAHQTLVTFRREGDVTLIAVVMCGTSKSNQLEDTAALFDYGFEKFRAETISAEEQAETAQAAYPNADVDALRSTLVLLPQGMKSSAISLSCDEADGTPVLRARLDGKDALTVPLTLMTQGAPSGGELDGEAVPTVAVGQSSAFSGALRIALSGAGVLVFLFVLLCLYRTVRIRKNRARVRALRERARRDDYRDRY